MSLDKTLETILRSECAHLGTQFTSRGGSTVVAQPSGRRLFAKIESSVEQTVGEAESLKAMGAALSDDDGKGGEGKLTPEVHASGKSDDGRAYLITDYLDLKPSISRSGQKVLGQRLAEMHKRGVHPDGRFGFGVATYCGVTRQENSWNTSWPKFWADQRIGDLVNRINADQGDPELKDLEQQMRDRVYPVLLAPLEAKVKPSILHGDLWSGNAGTVMDTGEPAIFDSSYYGHNEAELGIMNMFGGFTRDFFDAYHAVIPRTEPYYNERLRLYELYHHLNHLLMFRGGYRSGAVSIMRSLIQFCDNVDDAK
ncbi:Fructosamine/Ketosamine-3-kinase [Kalmanozyma brasiliensis GHG001]|uniref:Fructosamine/Ketosamine-3-kinase n=1 Tax=Kalmanozyma brasiliensis (strain GHG001) TaxID=1365824 RepID=UPI002867C3D1|nr:Fructosamine/Ketosamine-3-kinase [Kalmanozyma brasiliensis GHG001]EST09464.2 Fructosamine/Ketosamine-3-kinase [Kalmanozyma brasiliensis GHG001]